MSLSKQIKQKALELDFDIVGITDASPIDSEHVEILSDWLKAGLVGQMDYMYRNFHKRINPAELLETAKSVIVVGLNYNPPETKTKPKKTSAPSARVANYAQYEDYHSFIKKQLHILTDFLSRIVGDDFEYKICVDSAPVAERALAARAGLGFIGRNHMLINPKFGPQILLAEVITNLQLQTDQPIEDSCSNCSNCINACPTGALRADGRFDAAKCISYLTIEYKGRIPFDLTTKIGNWIFGCDECVLACPYKKDTPVCTNKQFRFYADRARLDLQKILRLNQTEFKTEFADSPIKRTGLEQLKRNAKICLANIISRKHSTK